MKNIADFGMDTISMAGTLPAKLAAMRAAGFGQVMLSARDITGHAEGVDAAIAAVRASGLRVTGFQVLRDFEGLSGHLHDYKVDIARSMLEMGAALGSRVLLACSSTSTHATADLDAVARDLRKLAMLALPLGLEVGCLRMLRADDSRYDESSPPRRTSFRRVPLRHADAGSAPAFARGIMDLTALTISQAAAALQRGEVTAAAYAEALLARAALGAGLNAFIHHDPAQVRAAAHAADERRARSGSLGPLHGVPLALKDNLDTADMPTTAGTPGLRGNRPARNAPVVQKLLDAGAIVFGKTNLHELAYGITNNNAAFGAARNPYDPTRIPGASSGGVGVAVAARMAPGGIGSDTGGSVRIPAALCGIVGFRPTTGRWSQAGIVPISHTRDTAGPMTRSVADCVLLDSVVTGRVAAAAASLEGLRLGVPRAHFWDPLDTEVARLMAGVLAALKDAGAVLVEADIADVGRLDGEAGFPIALYETVVDLDAYLAEHGSPLRYAELVAQCASPDVAGILQSLHGAGAIPEAAYRHALGVLRPELQAAYRDYFQRHDVAAVVFPTTPLAAAPIGEDETVLLNGERVPTFATFIRNSSPGSVAGVPGISLPAALTKSGLPLGFELDGPAGTDARLLSIARAVERVLPEMPAPKL